MMGEYCRVPVNEAWTDIVPDFLRAPTLVYKHRKLVKAWIFRRLLAIGWGRTDVVVLGKPGTGKSVLMERLAGRSGDLNWSAPDVSTVVESVVVTVRDEPLLFRTIPGQESRERDNGLHEALSRHKKLQGIIYVVDWGFNAPRDLSVQRDRIDRGGIDSIEMLRESNLAAELEDFSEVTSRIQSAHSRTNGKFWVLIVVNKADLFFDRLQEAQNYYHPEASSEFKVIMDDLRNRIGRNNIFFEVVPVSSWHEDFHWNGRSVKSHMDESQARALFFKYE